MKKFDLIVVGGGALGTFHALHALQRGLSVALIERHQTPESATVRNFGQIVPSGMNSKWQRMGRRSLEIYQDLQAQTDISARKNGTVYLASNAEEQTLLEELAVINQAEGYASHLLTKQQCLSKYEGLRADYCVGGLFFPNEITLEPRVAIGRVLGYLTEQRGLHYLPNQTAVAIEENAHGCSVTTARNTQLEAAKVLIFSGSEFKILYPAIFENSDIVAVKLQMILTAPQPKQRFDGSILTGLSIRRYEAFGACPSYASIKQREDPNSFAKRWGVHILFKQALDGSVIVGDTHEYAPAAQADSLGFDNRQEMNTFMLTEAQQIFQLQNWDIQQVWNGVYCQCKTTDIFQHNVSENVHIVTGIGGKGMTGSPGFAEQHIKTLFA
ncbi:MAG: TIGR03364 family FAD-dependent oxidoreductase [Cytophagia bacterium]|nr:MAG: TIGR03364 family FAD-dependent oxidoreductase [Runella sp.]TAG21665.1 MAG: TIGR03364 family FAD-dependent oxidoreductase [Cytophagales bacterium]TAG41057.1 MAG: TIGR03364 family FAD-dependent oxidoreductase [Cytophagia bacterium]TAG54122.1 MAG: TIGR03364 family FAD-dependent oxidoreductase [Runella slithyformis]TAG83850.1 MAG: TIGR03364 family FAD-dependent oxidoreductase [Cytophagales bacterium]